MSVKKILLLLVIAAPVATAAVFVILWYQHLPLRTAVFYRDAGDINAALASVDQYLAAYPGDEYALSLRGQLFCEANRFQEAIDIYNVIGPATADDMLCFTKALVSTQRWQMAANVSETYDKKYGPHAENYLWAIISLTNLGRMDAAVIKSRNLAQIEGRESQGLLLFGELRARQNAGDDAVQAYSKALELNPEATNLHIPPEAVYESFADLLLGLGRSQEALDVVERGLAIAETPSLHYYRGMALLNLGKVEEAKLEWQLANRSAPHVLSLLELAKQLLAEGDPERAASVMGLLKNMEQIDSRMAFLMQSITDALGDAERAQTWKEIYEKLRREETIEGVMLQAIADQPYNKWSVVFRAYFSTKSQRWQEAEEMLKSVEPDFLDEKAFLVLREAVRAKRFGPDVMNAMEAEGIGQLK